MLLPDRMSDCLEVVCCFKWLLCLKRFMSSTAIFNGIKSWPNPRARKREFWQRHHLGPCNYCYHPWKVETGWTGASCRELSLPGQTGYQQVAFWDGAGKAQTVWCARLGARFPTLAQFPHLPSLTHLLTVWTVSSRRRHYIFFPFSVFWHLFVVFLIFLSKPPSKQPLFLQGWDAYAAVLYGFLERIIGQSLTSLF